MKRLVSYITLAISLLSLVSGEKEKSFQVFLLAGQSNMQGQGVVDICLLYTSDAADEE